MGFKAIRVDHLLLGETLLDLQDLVPTQLSPPTGAAGAYAVIERYAGNKTCIRDVAGRFDMGESTLSRILNRLSSCAALLQMRSAFPAMWQPLPRILRRFQAFLGSWVASTAATSASGALTRH
ncbi:hypothetical protein HPB47_000490, partial [Ixodes persulcatus]